MKSAPAELRILTRINRKIIFLGLLQFLLIASTVTLVFVQRQKSIKLIYQEHTADFSNPIINIDSANENLSATKLYEENNIINFLKKTLTLVGGYNPYINQIAQYNTSAVNQYYKENISTKIFYKNIDEKKLLKNFNRNIKIESISELSNRVTEEDGIIQKIYQLDIKILEYPPLEEGKIFETKAQVNLIISYHSQKKIIALEKNMQDYKIINPLNLKINNLFIALR